MLQECAAYSTLALTVGLVVARPRIRGELRIGPATAATTSVVILALLGALRLGDLRWALEELGQPLIAIVSIMLLSASAHRLRVLESLSARFFSTGSAAGLFAGVFVLGVVTATLLNNDAAILLLTPLAVAVARRKFPARPGLAAAFAFTVFLSAGVAPLPVSNPMNLIVASHAGLGFFAYTGRMIPIALFGAVVAFVILRLLFHRVLAGAGAASHAPERKPWSGGERQLLVLLIGVLASYPVAALIGWPSWKMTALGAAGALLIVARQTPAKGQRRALRELIVDGVSWEIILFLISVLLMAVAFRNLGLGHTLSAAYQRGGLFGIGLTSAVGSAVLNNHPMSMLNVIALDELPRAGSREVLAALIGGDLGPRLLPMGSLAGLLWLECLRRLGIEIPLRRFLWLGTLVMVPTLLVSLLVLQTLP